MRKLEFKSKSNAQVQTDAEKLNYICDPPAKKPGGGTRNYCVDVFRICLMCMIVCHHSIIHGMNLSSLQSGQLTEFKPILFFLNAFCVVAVNCFFFISGYFGIRFSTKKLFGLYLECAFYILIFNLFYSLIGVNEINVLSLVKKCVLPFNRYWFMLAYCIVFILAPFLNIFLDSMKSKSMRTFIVLLLGIYTVFGFIYSSDWVGDGYNAAQGIYIYLLASCIKRLNLKPKKIYCVLGYVLISCLLGLLSFQFAVRGYQDFAWKVFQYNNPLIVISSVILCLFVIQMQTTDMKNKLIVKASKLSRYSLAVYLITELSGFREQVFWGLNYVLSFFDNSMMTVILIILNAIILTAICMFVDMIRCRFARCIPHGVLNPLYERIDDKMQT